MVRPRKLKLPVDRITRSYRKPGGTTGRPRVQRPPPKPLLSIGISPNPGPGHGVSGYRTTGVAGGLSVANSSTGINSIGNVDSSVSRYSLSATPGTGEGLSSRLSTNSSFSQSSNYGYWSPGGSIGPADVLGYNTPSRQSSTDSFYSNYAGLTSPIRQRMEGITGTNPMTGDPTTFSANTSEPTLEELLELDADLYLQQAQRLPRDQVLQQERSPHRQSLLDEHAERGLYQWDLTMQAALARLDQHLPAEQPHGDVATPARPERLHFFPQTPQTAPRNSQLQNNGTFNNGMTITMNPPSGQTGQPAQADRNTPAYITPGYTNPANHPMYGPVPSANVDGSWTLNIMPGQAQPTLATMAPAADIPVQLNGPGQLSETAAFASDMTKSRPRVQQGGFL